MHQSAQPKNPSGRRRQGRNNANNNNSTTPRKMYASENDIPTHKANANLTSPCTPQRQRTSGGDQSTSLQTSSANPKQRNNNNKSNRKNNKAGGAISPGHHKPDRLSPPMPSRQESTPAIFAGSTFHASPAPSALPMPSFFARSHSDSPAVKPATGPPAPGQEPSPPSTDSEDAITPPRVLRNEESPLEFFFRADRAEKARTHRANSVSAVTAVVPGPFSPPHDSPREQHTVPRMAAATHHGKRPAISQRSTTSGIPSNELDGNPGQPLGPAFSTPYQDRIRAARSSSNSVQATPTVSQNRELDPSEALKRFLFHGQLSPTAQDTSRTQRTPRQMSPKQSQSPRRFVSQQPSPPEQIPERQSLPRGMFPASVLKGYPSGALPSKAAAEAVPTSSQRSDIVTMEDSLRRMLKLSPSS